MQKQISTTTSFITKSCDTRPDDPENSAARGMHILVVDDEPSILVLLKTALEAIGRFNVHQAQGPIEALQILDTAQRPFELILLDVQMPCMTGVELCSAIRKRPEYGNIPILMLTAMSERDYLGAAFEAGANDYIAKPFEFVELQMRIGRALQLKHSRNRLDQERRLSSEGPAKNQRHLQIGLEHKTRLNGVERVVGANAFETYVKLASQHTNTLLVAQAVKIQHFDRLFESLSQEELHSLLQEIALILSETNKHDGGLISYRGSGIFLCVSTKHQTMDCGVLHKSLCRSELLRDIASSSGVTVRVVVGSEAALDRAPKGQAIFALNAAIEEVERSDPQASNWSTYAQWKRCKKTRQQETAHFERRGYEALLQDFLIEQKRSAQ